MDAAPGFAVPSSSRRLRARRMADQLLALLERQIDEGRIKPGERLAPERELAAQFGASRNVVRAALAELHKAGKITRRVGHGTVVVAPAEAPRVRAPLQLLDASPVELLEFRLAMEPGLAEAIILNARESDLQAIKACVEAGDAASQWEEWEHWDRAFHKQIIAATHNRLAIGVYDAVIAVRHERPWLKLKQGHTDPVRWRQYQEDHRRIAEAVLARDAAATSEAIRAHLLAVRAKMLGQ
ncbi:MAG TPA: FCD domain-containing protein [Stellaceae bacterium]|nr:FCD domain-containing protein [Stellaceae bacterium]